MKLALQTAVGILIAVSVIVTTHETYAVFKWRKTAYRNAVDSHEESLRFAEKTGITAASVDDYYYTELSKPNPYSWFQ